MLVVRTKLADEDLLDIWFYVGADDMDAADRLLDQIEARCDSLGQYPQKGCNDRFSTTGFLTID
jgi:toxin ParE1/3/4